MVVKLWNNTKHAENIIFLTLSDIGNSEPEEGKEHLGTVGRDLKQKLSGAILSYFAGVPNHASWILRFLHGTASTYPG